MIKYIKISETEFKVVEETFYDTRVIKSEKASLEAARDAIKTFTIDYSKESDSDVLQAKVMFNQSKLLQQQQILYSIDQKQRLLDLFEIAVEEKSMKGIK